nr:immunoglobulin heavy chain junction region [Macaca mulatta]
CVRIVVSTADGLERPFSW